MNSFWQPRYLAFTLVVMGVGVAVYKISLPLRASAQKASCQSNLKQIGLATMQYVRDYDEIFMLAPKWKKELAPYGKFYQHPDFAPAYMCPTTERDYTFNDGLSGAMMGLVKSPQTMATFYEPSHPVNADGGQSWESAGIHGAGSNVCYHDGHVKWVQTKPIFWVPELATKAEAKHRRDEESRRFRQRMEARNRLWQQNAKRKKEAPNPKVASR